MVIVLNKNFKGYADCWEFKKSNQEYLLAHLLDWKQLIDSNFTQNITLIYNDICWKMVRPATLPSILVLVLSKIDMCCAQSLNHVWLFATPWTVARQASLLLEFSRQEDWSGLLSPTPGDPRDRTWVSCIGMQILYH